MESGSLRVGSQPGVEIDRRIFGGFLEHVGRAVYGGIYEPGHPTAGPDGMRRDVIEAVKELGATLVRYPGGNFVSAYNWEDGVGPVAERPVRLDPAWHSLEPNEVGTAEFIGWARTVGAEPMMAVNLGTRGVADAMRLLEYCNASVGALAELRRSHGHDEPFGVRSWCLGNEMDGEWQLGHRTAEDYGRLAEQTAHAMRCLDDSLELVACGPSGPDVPWFEEWIRQVLRLSYTRVDQLSCHWYVSEDDVDLTSFLASGAGMDRYIERAVAIADEVGAELGSDKRIDLSFDEWNVWNMRRHQQRDTISGIGNWPFAPPLLEEEYTLVDGVAAGSLLMSLIAHADRVKVACIAQLVNAIAPIMTVPGGPVWRQTTFHPFALSSVLAGGALLPVELDVPSIDTQAYGTVPAVQAVAGVNQGRACLLLVNRYPDRSISLKMGFEGHDGPLEVVSLAGEDLHLTNNADHPDRVTPSQRQVAGGDEVVLPPASWSRVRPLR